MSGPTKVKKLAIAAYAAPRVRNGSARRIKITDPEGRVVREVDAADVTAKVMERAGIEFEVHKGVIPTHKICPCGRLWTAPRPSLGKGWRSPDACPACRSQAVCIGWDGPCPDAAKPHRASFSPGAMKARGGGPWRCNRCDMRRTQADRTRKMTETTRQPDERAARTERATEWHRSLGHKEKEALTRSVRLGVALRDGPPDERRLQSLCAGWDGPCPDAAKPSAATLTPRAIRRRNGEPWRCRRCNRPVEDERRRKSAETKRRPEVRAAVGERTRAWHASLTPEQKKARADATRAWHASLTPEEKAARKQTLHEGREAAHRERKAAMQAVDQKPARCEHHECRCARAAELAAMGLTAEAVEAHQRTVRCRVPGQHLPPRVNGTPTDQ